MFGWSPRQDAVSIRDFVRLGCPFAKQLLGIFARKLNHRQRSRCDLERDLLIDEIVVESNPGRVAAAAGEVDFVEPRPVDRRQTHGTRLTAGVEHASAQIKALQAAASIANGGHLRVGCRIEKLCHLIAATTYYLASGNNDRAKRAAAFLAHSGTTKRDGFVHPAHMLGSVVAVIRHRFGSVGHQGGEFEVDRIDQTLVGQL